jgi:putative phosphoserine phosphatase/1-acylglycerol-3-phosphate O-acyltransferase
VKEKKEEAKDVKERGRNIAALFDLDGTLVARPSLERRFFQMLRYRRTIAAKNYWLWLAEAVRLAPRALSAIWHGNKMYLRGVAVGRPVEGGLKPATSFFEDGIERAGWHAKQGHTIVIVSGTLEPLAQEIARAIEAELAVRGMAVTIRVCATRLEQMHGRWTGKILGEAVFGKGKLRAALRMAAEMKLDLEKCYAYADSSSDRWLLAAVGRPIVANPSNDLARLARIRGWPVMNWEGRENLAQRHRGHREIAEKNELPSVTT